MARQKKATTEIKKSSDESLFPYYETFPYRLEHKEGKGKKLCYFQHESHVVKYIERHKLSTYVAYCFTNK